MRHRNAQFSVEFVVIFAIILASLVPLMYFFFAKAAETRDVLADAEIQKVGFEFLDTIQTVYSSGPGARVVVNFLLPESINSIRIIDNREIVFTIETSTGLQEFVYFSNIPIISDQCLGSYCNLNDIATSGPGEAVIQTISGSTGPIVMISKNGNALPSTFSDQVICANAEANGLCAGLDLLFGPGYRAACQVEHGLC